MFGVFFFRPAQLLPAFAGFIVAFTPVTALSQSSDTDLSLQIQGFKQLEIPMFMDSQKRMEEWNRSHPLFPVAPTPFNEPDMVSLRANVKLIKEYMEEASVGPFEPDHLSKLMLLLGTVSNTGPWDYKRKLPLEMRKSGLAKDLGNFNYGLVIRALGISKEEARLLADTYQVYTDLRVYDKSLLEVLSNPGDDPRGSELVDAGLDFSDQHLASLDYLSFITYSPNMSGSSPDEEFRLEPTADLSNWAEQENERRQEEEKRRKERQERDEERKRKEQEQREARDRPERPENSKDAEWCSDGEVEEEVHGGRLFRYCFR